MLFWLKSRSYFAMLICHLVTFSKTLPEKQNINLRYLIIWYNILYKYSNLIGHHIDYQYWVLIFLFADCISQTLSSVHDHCIQSRIYPHTVSFFDHWQVDNYVETYCFCAVCCCVVIIVCHKSFWHQPLSSSPLCFKQPLTIHAI